MLKFIDEKGEEYLVQAEIRVSNGVNGERSITGEIHSNDKVIHAIGRGWKLEHEDEFYKIIYALPVDEGKNIVVEFDAVHQFFFDFDKSMKYAELNGSNTFDAYLNFIFKDSGYSYRNEVKVDAFEKQSFGFKSRLTLFKDIISSVGVEFVVSGKVVRIVEKVGTDLSTIVKKGFNLQDLRLEHNIGSFITYKKGYGAYIDPEDESKGRLEVEYESPLAKIYGRLEGVPVVDERYTKTDSLFTRIKKDVDNSYSVAVSLTMEDLNDAGYQQKRPVAGDYIMAINKDLDFKERVRIVSFESFFDIEGNIIDHNVSCNSLSMGSRSNNNDSWKDEIEAGLENAKQNADKALVSANGKNMTFYGAYEGGEPKATKVNDTWYKTVGEETIVYIWDGKTWVELLSTIPNTIIKEKIEELEEISKDAQEKADQAIEDAGFSKIEVGKIKEEFNSVQIEVDKIGEISMDASNKSNQALIEAEASRQTANEAKEQSFNSEQIANSAKQDAITAIQKGDQNSTQIITLEGQQKLTNTKVEGNTANILNLQTDSEKLSLSIGKVQADVDGMEIGGTNLIVRTGEVLSSMIGPDGKPTIYHDSTRSIVPIKVSPNEEFYFWQEDDTYLVNRCFRYAWFDVKGDLIARENLSGFKEKIVKSPNYADTLQVSYAPEGKVKIGRGNKKTDWSPSPGDMTTKSEFATFEANVNGFQQTVNNDISGIKSQQTQMDGQISSTIEKVDDLSYLGRNLIISKFLKKGFIDASGVYQKSEGGLVTHMVPIKDEKYITGTMILDSPMQYGRFAYYDSNYVFISRTLYQGLNVKTEKIPLHAKYVIFSPDITTGTDYREGYKFEFGSKATKWQLAPEDNASKSEVIQLSDQITQTVNKIETVDGKVNKQQTQITQLSDQINSKVDKTDFDSLTGTVTQQGTEIAQLSDRITQTVTRIETVDGKVVAQQTQITQLDNKITQVVKEQTELNTKYSKIEQTTDAIRSEVAEIGQAVADIGTYVNYLINSDMFSDSLPYTIGMSGPTLSSVDGTEMVKGKLKLVQRYNNVGYYVISDQKSTLPRNKDITFSGKFEYFNLNCLLEFRVGTTTVKTMNLTTTKDFEFTFKTPSTGAYSLFLYTDGRDARTYSYFDKLKVNEGSKRVENTVDTASLNARISTVEQTSEGLKTEVALIKNDQIVQSSQITQLSDNINLRVEKNKVISQINISPETIRLESKLIHLSGKSLIDNAVIKSAMIDTMSANKLTAGTINAAEITVINLNASNISTGILKAIDITGSLITGSNFTTVGDNTTVTINEGVISINSNTTGNIAKFGLNTTYLDGLFLQIPKGIYMTGIRPDTSGFFSINFKNNKMQVYIPPVVGGITSIRTSNEGRTAEFFLDSSDRAGVTGYNGVSFGERNSSGTTDQLGTWNTRELKILTPTIIENSLSVRGAKNAIHESSQGWIATPAYETAESYLGDIGTATTDENGNVVIFIDELFSEIINTEEHEYHVFLQSYRYESPVFVLSRNEKYFTVKSKLPQTVFAYELKAKRRGYETDRLKKMEE